MYTGHYKQYNACNSKSVSNVRTTHIHTKDDTSTVYAVFVHTMRRGSLSKKPATSSLVHFLRKQQRFHVRRLRYRLLGTNTTIL
jgi:hypothetical protein